MTTLRLPQVKAKTGLSKSRIYALIKEGRFPKPGKVGETSLWLESEVDEFLARLFATRDNHSEPVSPGF